MNQIKAGVILNFITIGLTTLTGLLYTPYMMRCLGQNEYGLYSLVASIIAYFSVLDTGISNAVVRFTARFRDDTNPRRQHQLYGMTLIANLALSLIVIACGTLLIIKTPTLFDRTMSADDILQARIMLTMLIINLALTFPLGVFTSIVNAYERFIFTKSLNILRIILLTLTIILLLSQGYKAVAMVAAQVTFNILLLLAGFIYALRRLHIRVSIRPLNIPLLREVTIYSFWIFINSLTNRIYWSTGQFILGITSGTIAVAIFSASVMLQQMYFTLTNAISGVLLPKITRLTTADTDPDAPRRISDLFISTGRLQASLLLLILSGFILFGRSFFALWAGPGYEDSFLITLIFFIAIFPYSVENTGTIILQARNQMRTTIIIELTVAALSIPLQYILALHHGPIGCAIAIGLALFIGPGLLFNRYYRRHQQLDTPRLWRQILRMSPLPILLTALLLPLTRQLPLTHPLHFLTALILYLLLYLPLYWRLTLTPPERSLLRSLLPNASKSS